MSSDKPWYLTLFERDWYDELAPGGKSSAIDHDEYAERTEKEASFIADALGLAEDAAILDLCCGWGRHTIPLAERGFRMSGLDLSAYHIAIARENAAKAKVEVEWQEGDMRRLPQDDGSFDAVINMFTAFGYFDDAENQQVLEEIGRVLKPSGRLLMDVINRDYLMWVFRDADWRERDDGALILERRRWDAETGRVHAAWTIVGTDGQRRTHSHDERVYTREELKLRLAAAGISVVRTFGGYDGSDLQRTSPRLIVLAERL